MSKGRGLEPELTSKDVPVKETPKTTVETKPTTTVNQITKIISHGSGWIQVQYSNGTKEKRTGGTISWRYNNPGNLKIGPFARSKGAVGGGWGSHAVFPTYDIGYKAKYDLVFGPERGYDKMTLLQAMNKYAPSNDKGKGVPKGGNQPNVYATFIAKKVGISTSVKLESLNETQRKAMLNAMEVYEGFQKGVSTKL